MDVWTLLGRVGLAFLLGAIVGWERERGSKPAGLRTLTLVGTGSALFVLAAQWAAAESGDRLDILRIVAGIAQGIGFLGAGTIVVTHGTVHGLTTAAAVWAVSAVGTACGLGAWPLAAAGTLAIFIALRALAWVETRISGNESERP